MPNELVATPLQNNGLVGVVPERRHTDDEPKSLYRWTRDQNPKMECLVSVEGDQPAVTRNHLGQLSSRQRGLNESQILQFANDDSHIMFRPAFSPQDVLVFNRE